MRLARAIDRWMGELARSGRTESTRASYSRHLNKLIDHLERTKPAPDVRMLAGTKGWQEFLCLTILAYTGVRRDAASRLRWKDVDLDAGTVTFRDKGSKYAERPISDDLVAILRSA